MKFSGRIFEVTNLVDFAPSYILNSKAPKASSFKPAAGIRLHVASVAAGFPQSFIPGISVKTNSASDGKFNIILTEGQMGLFNLNKKAYVLAYRNAGSLNILGTNITIYEPVYRSQAFDITTYKEKPVDIYFAPYDIPNKSGITQAQVDAQITAAKKNFKDLSKLSATIQNRKVSVSGSGRGADIKFNIDISSSTSSNLDNFLNGKVDDMDIDLPGPDFLVGICVSKDDIEKEIEKGIVGIMKQVNATIEKTMVDELAKQTGQSKALLQALLKSTASVTFSKLNYPIVEQKVIKLPIVGSITLQVRGIVPKLSIGFPRVVG